MKTLNAFYEDTLIGVFEEREDDDSVTFSYESTATLPLSLSLPLNESWGSKVPGRWLDNLLPDSQAARRQLADRSSISKDIILKAERGEAIQMSHSEALLDALNIAHTYTPVDFELENQALQTQRDLQRE